jgi:Predicted permease
MTTSTEADEENRPKAEPRAPLSDPGWWRGLLGIGFGKSFWGFLAFAVVAGAACWLMLGEAAFFDALRTDIDLILRMMPRVAIALTVAGFLWVTLPRDRVTALIGTESGLRGLLVATLAGIVTPGGPSSAFALLAVLGGAGADRGAMVAYIVSWAILGIQRILVWDVPFMGADFSLVRFLVCLPLPFITGMIARRLPLTVTLVDHRSRGR